MVYESVVEKKTERVNMHYTHVVRGLTFYHLMGKELHSWFTSYVENQTIDCQSNSTDFFAYPSPCLKDPPIRQHDRLAHLRPGYLPPGRVLLPVRLAAQLPVPANICWVIIT